MINLRNLTQKQSKIIKIIIFIYLIFNGCFSFFDIFNTKANFMYFNQLILFFISFYLAGFTFAFVYKDKFDIKVILNTLFFTVIGMILRYVFRIRRSF